MASCVLPCSSVCTQAHPPPPAAGPASGVRDNTPQSALLLQGGRAMHGLFDVLLNETGFQPSMDEPCDLPTLLAPVPFDGATMYRPLLKVRGGIKVYR